MIRGLYRVHGVDGGPDDVRLEDNGIEVPLEEGVYRARGYQPQVADLPWQEDYLRRDPSANSASSAREATEKAARERARQDFFRRFRKA